MSMMKWATPFEEIDLLRKEMDHLLGSTTSQASNNLNPPVEVVENENRYRVRMSLPGLLAERISEHVHIDATAKTVTISGEIPPHDYGQSEKVLVNQFRFGKFLKQLSFPDGIDHENIEAHYRNGLLEITLQKAMNAQKRSVEIQIQ